MPVNLVTGEVCLVRGPTLSPLKTDDKTVVATMFEICLSVFNSEVLAVHVLHFCSSTYNCIFSPSFRATSYGWFTKKLILPVILYTL